MKKSQNFLFILTAIALTGCAHSYYYIPETAGDGVIHSRGGIVYSVPPNEPTFKMKLVSLGVNKKTLGIRMYFVRPSHSPALSSGFLDPKDQFLILNGEKISPTKIHASTEKKPLIELSQQKKQAIELFFPLPLHDQKAKDIQFFSLQWKVHYSKTGEETQTARFDRRDSRPQQGAEMYPGDSDYPYDESPVLPPGWIADDWAFWDMM
jgi:hypothetical protein